MVLNLFLAILLLFAQQEASYDDLMQQVKDKLSSLVEKLSELKSYKFDYGEIQRVTLNLSKAIELINEAELLQEKGFKAEAEAKLIEAIRILDNSIVEIDGYLNHIKEVNNSLRNLAFILVPSLSFATAYLSLTMYQILKKRRARKILTYYVRFKKGEDR